MLFYFLWLTILYIHDRYYLCYATAVNGLINGEVWCYPEDVAVVDVLLQPGGGPDGGVPDGGGPDGGDPQPPGGGPGGPWPPLL